MPLISPSLSDFEIDLLRGLWQASLFFTMLSLAVAAALVSRRHFENRGQIRQAARRAELERIMWGALASPVPASLESLPAIQQEDIMLVCDAALDILRPLRGEEAARIVKLLETWPVRNHIRRLLTRGRRGQRIRMLSLLAHFNDAESLELLRQSITASDFYVQLAALRSLAARDAIETLPNILASLIHAKRQNTTMLADVLRRFGEPALSMLTTLAAGGAQLEVRLAAIKALGVIASLQAVPPLMTLAEDPSPEIRAATMSALGLLGDVRAEAAVLKALSDNHDGVRVQATRAAGRLHLKAATPALAALLSDPFWWVRYRAAEALHGMGMIGHRYLDARSKENGRAGHIAAQVLAEKEAA